MSEYRMQQIVLIWGVVGVKRTLLGVCEKELVNVTVADMILDEDVNVFFQEIYLNDYDERGLFGPTTNRIE